MKRYFKAGRGLRPTPSNWFDTGDVAAIHPDGTMQITDRAKDVIKSGGEWISSIELENAAVGCPGVAEAAAIGIPHPKWDERPLLLRRPRRRAATSRRARSAIICRKQVAKWWLPDAIEFVDELAAHGHRQAQQEGPARPIRDYRFADAEAMVGRD